MPLAMRQMRMLRPTATSMVLGRLASFLAGIAPSIANLSCDFATQCSDNRPASAIKNCGRSKHRKGARRLRVSEKQHVHFIGHELQKGRRRRADFYRSGTSI